MSAAADHLETCGSLDIGRRGILGTMADMARPSIILRWIPLTVLALGALVGAWVGASAGATSTSTVPAVLRQIIEATRTAGSAKLTYSATTVGSTLLLSNTLLGHGVVDFRSGEYRTISIQHSTELAGSDGGPERPSPNVSTEEEVFYKGHAYVQVPGQHLGQSPWIKFPTVIETPPIVFGSFDQSEATQALTPLSEPYRDLSIAAVGRQLVEGIHTMLYRVTVSLRQCNEGLAGNGTPITVNLWVDRAQRLVQARTTTKTTYSIPKKALALGIPSELSGAVVTTSTLEMYDYGAHVQIGSPQPIVHPSGSAHGSGFFSVASSCPRSKNKGN